MLEKFEI